MMIYSFPACALGAKHYSSYGTSDSLIRQNLILPTWTFVDNY